MNLEKELKLIKQYFPSGGIWNAKNIPETDLYKLITSFALVLASVRSNSEKAEKELNIYNAENIIEKWEHFVGLPDDIIKTIPNNIDDRIQNVLQKLLRYNIRTKQELITFLQQLYPDDITSIEIYNLIEKQYFPFKFPIYFCSPEVAKNTTIVALPKRLKNTFPFTFPFKFGAGKSLIIESIVRSFAPYYANIIFQYTLEATVDEVKENIIGNGNFAFWQRGDSFNINNTIKYTSDGWEVSVETGDVVVDKIIMTDEERGVLYSENCLQIQEGVNNQVHLIYKHFNVKSVNTGQHVFSFYAKMNNGSPKTIKLQIGQFFGIGGDSDVLCLDTTINLTSEYQLFTNIFNVPSVDGKTMTGDTYFFIKFIDDSTNENDEIKFTEIKLENNSQRTNFVPRINDEVKLKTLYLLQRSTTSDFSLGDATYVNSTTMTVDFTFPYQMRNPSVYSLSGTGIFYVIISSTTYNATSFDIDINDYGYTLTLYFSSIPAQDGVCYIQQNEWIQFGDDETIP